MIAIVLMTMLVAATGGQEGSPPNLPVLPTAVADEVKADENTVAEALTHLDNVDELRKAVPLAERALADRRANQGKAWWETIDVQQNLATRRATTMAQSNTAEPFASARFGAPILPVGER